MYFVKYLINKDETSLLTFKKKKKKKKKKNFREFRMKYFKDIDILYEKFYIISKYCPISNSNVNTVITDYYY